MKISTLNRIIIAVYLVVISCIGLLVTALPASLLENTCWSNPFKAVSRPAAAVLPVLVCYRPPFSSCSPRSVLCCGDGCP